MTLCAYCGHPTVRLGSMCGYHASEPAGADWSRGNRIMCDFIHRGIVAPVSRVRARESLDVLFDRLQTAMVA